MAIMEDKKQNPVDAQIAKLPKTKMSVLVDITRCTGCRGCQVACKQWNKNKPEETCFLGTYENPPDLSEHTFTRVKFREVEKDGKLDWVFKKIQCRHCEDPGCIDGVDKPAMKKYANGMVVVDPTVKVDKKMFEEIREACPYNVPRYDEKKMSIAKCTFCFDRRAHGDSRYSAKPACVTACPTGALSFGKREEILAEAEKREKALKAKFKNIDVVTDDTMWVYIVQHNESFEDGD